MGGVLYTTRQAICSPILDAASLRLTWKASERTVPSTVDEPIECVSAVKMRGISNDERSADKEEGCMSKMAKPLSGHRLDAPHLHFIHDNNQHRR